MPDALIIDELPNIVVDEEGFNVASFAKEEDAKLFVEGEKFTGCMLKSDWDKRAASETLYDVSIEDGKYRFVYYADTERHPEAFRHGEPWVAFTDTMLGSKVITSLVAEIAELREKLQTTETGVSLAGITSITIPAIDITQIVQQEDIDRAEQLYAADIENRTVPWEELELERQAPYLRTVWTERFQRQLASGVKLI